MRMPQIMVEAFAKGLIDKIMTEAFNVMDTDNGKLLLFYTKNVRADFISVNKHLESIRRRFAEYPRTNVSATFLLK